MPVGVVGEIYIGGVCVANGYFNRPIQTAERFVAISIPGCSESLRMYKTGDKARWLPDGNILFIARADEQIKWHGYRIEPGEISAVLSKHPMVLQSVVVLRTVPPKNHKQLVAYMTVAKENLELSLAENLIRDVRAYLASCLPLFMIPSMFVPLLELPKVSHGGKIDFKKLPEPEHWHRARSKAYVAPKNEVERVIVQIWQEALGLPVISTHDNFFGLGGHSLIAAEALTKIRTMLRVDVPLSELFNKPTACCLAQFISGLQLCGELTKIPCCKETPAYRKLSLSEEGMYMEMALLDDPTPYNEGVLIILQGKVIESSLRSAFAKLLARNDALRSTYKIGDDGVPFACECDSEILKKEVLIFEKVTNKTELDRCEHELLNIRFNLARGPLIKAFLLELSPNLHHLLLVLHHIVCDGFSFVLLCDRLAKLYNGEVTGTKVDINIPCNYADYVSWEQQTQIAVWKHSTEEYWRKQLQDFKPVPYPIYSIRSGVHRDNNTIRFKWDSDIVASIQRLAQKHGTTLFTVCLVSYQILLSHYLGTEDVSVISPWFNRPHADLDDVIGCFVNLLVLRCPLEETSSVSSLLSKGKGLVSEALAHPIPANWLVRYLGLATGGVVPSTFLLFFQNYGNFHQVKFEGCQTEIRDMDDGYLVHCILACLYNCVYLIIFRNFFLKMVRFMVK